MMECRIDPALEGGNMNQNADFDDAMYDGTERLTRGVPTQRSAEDVRVFVEHEVSFHLPPADRFVVPRRHSRGHVSVGYVTVHLHHDQRVWVHAHGSVCKKDGTPSAVTSMNESVDLPDEAHWVERAKAALIDGSADV